MTQGAQPPGGPAGTIHSLGYRRYEGRRLAPTWRFLVIARYAVSAQWRRALVKLTLVGALLFAGMGAMGNAFRWAAGAALARGEEGRRALEALAVVNALDWQFPAMTVLVAICGAPSVAADLNAGAFQFHFARPVAAGQYLAGRLLAAVAWAALVGYGTLALYCLERLAMAGAAGVAKAAAVGALAVTLRLAAFGAVALGCSSLTRRAALAQVMFVGAVLGTWIFAGIAYADTRRPWLWSLHVAGSSKQLAEQLLGAAALEGPATAAPALAALAWVAGGLAVAWARVARAEVVRG